MNIRGVDFILVLVTDLARASEFYRVILGLRQEVYSEEYQWAEFDCGNVTLALKGGEKRPVDSFGGRVALAVNDIHGAYQELREKGVKILNKPQDHGCCWHVDILDPDDNQIILHQRADGTAG